MTRKLTLTGIAAIVLVGTAVQGVGKVIEELTRAWRHAGDVRL
jgi:hypothetical protein